jgi:hypothetical protein
MSQITTENINILQDTSWKLDSFTALGVDGTPPKPQQIDFGTVTISDKTIEIVMDLEINTIYHAGGRLKAEIGAFGSLIGIAYLYKNAKQRFISLDVTEDTLTIDYGTIIETYKRCTND